MVVATEKPSAGSARINLRNVTVLCVDTNSLGLDVLSQMLMGFGVERIRRAASQEAARAILSKETIDFVVVDSNLEEESGYDLVRWLRQSPLDPNRFTPVIVTSSYTPASEIASARDCGANFLVAKPLSPSVLMQRMLWIAKGGRQFVEAEKYVGPDRRFKYDGVPEGTKGRRASDLSASLGVAKEPNLNQDQINSVLKPQRVAL